MENLVSYIPIALIVIGAVFAILYGIDEKLAKKVAIRTAAYVAAVIAIALLLTLHGAARAEEAYYLNTNDVYVRVGIIEYIDNENVCHIVDGAGVWWLWEKEPDDEFDEMDLVGLLIRQTGDPNSIYDDRILKMYYGGIV